MQNVLPRRLIEASARNVYGDPSRVTPELVDRYYELTLREGNRQALGQRFREVQREDLSAQIVQVRQPTLILWGSRDRLIPPEQAARFHKDIAGSQLKIFEGLGHVPQEEDPAATVGAVQAFLAQRR
ncbi:alpha/beta fold hydrolase [Variovorax sp. OV329]|uniref:alpha/beta fold hydrolase n=1 Tax=Variovorax sp. OV329 TaxID=1882825 RepID=UPI0008E572C9|nr:alpha/beta hydrolase [Variovorax sp. OV329]SFN06041.1 Alpha/beta hydrolase family protein [Variovorax sp. OV329]